MSNKDIAAAVPYTQRLVVAMERASQTLLDPETIGTSARRDLLHPDAELHRAVRAYVACRKSAGQSAEQVLVALKQSLAGFEYLPIRFETKPLTDLVISLCIEEYYRTT